MMNASSNLIVYGFLLIAVCSILGMIAGPGHGTRDFLIETATLGANPQPAVGLGAIQWIGMRFVILELARVEYIGANLAGSLTVFGAIVRLNGENDLPNFPPSQIESHALAGAAFTASSTVEDNLVPLNIDLGPGHYGAVFGIGPFGAYGGANLTTGNVPVAEASFFAAELAVVPDAWYDQPTLTGLRLFVKGKQTAVF